MNPKWKKEEDGEKGRWREGQDKKRPKRFGIRLLMDGVAAWGGGGGWKREGKGDCGVDIFKG